jgi:hypothetical protein
MTKIRNRAVELALGHQRHTAIVDRDVIVWHQNVADNWLIQINSVLSADFKYCQAFSSTTCDDALKGPSHAPITAVGVRRNDMPSMG